MVTTKNQRISEKKITETRECNRKCSAAKRTLIWPSAFPRTWRQLHDSLLVLTVSFEYQRADGRTLNDITV